MKRKEEDNPDFFRTLKQCFTDEKEKVERQLTRIEHLDSIDLGAKANIRCQLNNHFSGMLAILQAMQIKTRVLLLLPSDTRLEPDIPSYGKALSEQAAANG